MGVSQNGGTQQPWVFLLKMIILGCLGDTTIFGNTHINGCRISEPSTVLLRGVCGAFHHTVVMFGVIKKLCQPNSGRFKLPKFEKKQVALYFC